MEGAKRAWNGSLTHDHQRAALANGMLGHADETDDSHAPSFCAAALAMAEREGHNVRAVALGYNIGTRPTWRCTPTTSATPGTPAAASGRRLARPSPPAHSQI